MHRSSKRFIALNDLRHFSDVERGDCAIQAVERVTPVYKHKQLGERSERLGVRVPQTCTQVGGGRRPSKADCERGARSLCLGAQESLSFAGSFAPD